MKNITVSDINKNNLSLIYNLIYTSGKISKQELASQLNLSLPTITQKISTLKSQGLITKEGHFESSVGRRAVAYTICAEARIAIGVGIFKKQISILSVDLKGNICGSTCHDLEFEVNDSYYKEVAYFIKDFILEKNYLNNQILGIGFSVPGLTSVDGTKVIFGKTLGFTGLEITAFTQYLNYPCCFFHDVKCAANTELWFNDSISNALYLSLEKHLGGVLIMNGQILMGENGHCGALEHMKMYREGRKCYCGQYDCIETYCSIDSLLKPNEKIQDFFIALRKGHPEFLKRWDTLLENMAVAINNMNIFLDNTIIIGGELSHYMVDEDFDKLKKLTESLAVFSNKAPYIQRNSYPDDPFSLGASLYYIQDFLNQI